MKWRLVLFFVVETLAIGTMVLLLMRSRELLHCGQRVFRWDCREPPGVSFLLAMMMIYGELAFLATNLRSDGPVWGLMLALGVLAPVLGVSMTAMIPILEGAPVTKTLAAWHMVAGVPLLAAGAIGGVHAALTRRRIAHEHA
jgi:hypothetical protein